MATKGLTVNVRELEAFATRLDDIAGEELGKRVVGALNEVVDRTYDLARNRINAGINLTDDYVRRKITVERATASNPVATITAPGDKSANVPLRNYGAKVVTGPTARGTGQRRRGVEVEVGTGRNTTLLYGFMLPLRRGTEAGANGLGVFIRDKAGKIRHRYGPAVYQLFKYQIEKTPFTDEIEDDLESTLVDYAQAELQKVIA